MKCSYHPGYHVSLPPGHPFPISKYPLLKDRLLAEGVLSNGDLLEPEPLDRETLQLVHTSEYLNKLESSGLSAGEQRKLGLPWSDSLWMRSRLASGGTLLAARAAEETGRPAILTEHGIYTNERRIELLMAEWVADTVDKGHALDDPRFDLRDMWVRAFEAYARTCYEACAEVVTLYQDNQRVQKVLGADPGKLRVIANGIDLARFSAITPAPESGIPVIALIGRVVPIKDVKTYIRAAKHLAARLPALKAYVIGPTDEDEVYAEECRQLVRDQGLEAIVEFTGAVDIVQYMSRIHVVVLTSLSESQPLVVLEAGASGIPFVATDVGSCREILEGRPDEQPPLGKGGIVTDVVDDKGIADAVYSLLRDPALRRRYGETLRSRVRATYTSAQAVEAYRDLYARHLRDELWMVNAEAQVRPRAVSVAVREED